MSGPCSRNRVWKPDGLPFCAVQESGKYLERNSVGSVHCKRWSFAALARNGGPSPLGLGLKERSVSWTSAFVGFSAYLAIRLAASFFRGAVSYAKARHRETGGP
jgi:hypothetical protein